MHVEESQAELISSVSGSQFYRRIHVKPDGRHTTLYGWQPPGDPSNKDCLEGAGAGAQLRWHPYRNEWAIYAAHRQNRTFKPGLAENPLAPFRRGGATTEIEFEDYEIAVFQNRFASLHPDAEPSRPVDGSYKTDAAKGDCEVIVYDTSPEGSLATLSQDRRRLLVHAWIDRYLFHMEAGAEFVLPFENRGSEVGVTLEHPHGQIYAFPFVPGVQSRADNAFRNGHSLWDHLNYWRSKYEVKRVGPLSAYVPPFARYPYEVWVSSLSHRRGLWDFCLEEIEAFAELLGDITARYDRLFKRPAATMMSLQSAPKNASASFEFTTQFYPVLRGEDRVKYFASVEQSTGVFTVDVLPEAAAQQLRGA